MFRARRFRSLRFQPSRSRKPRRGAACATAQPLTSPTERAEAPLFPTHLRATGVGASVAVGRVGAIIGNVILGLSASAFGLFTGFALLAGFWLIGAAAAAIWWLRGVEGRGKTLEALSPPPVYSPSTR